MVTLTLPNPIAMPKPSQQKEVLKDSVVCELIQASADIKAGRNLSPVFNTAEEMYAYLEKGIAERRRRKR